MSTRMSSRYGKIHPSRMNIEREATTKNEDGYPAFTLPLEEQYLQMLMTNVIGNTFYASANRLADESMNLHRKMLNYDPVFMAKAIVYARNYGYMRLQPTIGLAYLTLLKDLNLFRRIFRSVIKTPKDLKDFVTFLPNIRKGRGLSSKIKAVTGDYLNDMSEYHAIKYSGTADEAIVCNRCGNKMPAGKKHITRCWKCNSSDIGIQTYWGMRDILRVVRPKPISLKQSNTFKYIVRGKDCDLSQLPQIRCLEQLKHITQKYRKGDISSKAYFDAAVSLIEEGRLPQEVITGTIELTKDMWAYVMKQMPIFALLRNLNTLDKNGIFNNDEYVRYVERRLTDRKAISKSMLWPNRVATAYRMYNGNPRIKDALRDMADLTFDNLPTIPGDTEVFIDISGSMNGKEKEHGAILGLAAVKSSDNAEVLCFGSQLWYPDISLRDSLLTNVDRVTSMHGGGTDIGNCIDHLLGECASQKRSLFGYMGGYHHSVPKSIRRNGNAKKVDNIIIFTDEQQNSGSPVLAKFRSYRNRVNKDAKLFIVDVSPYGAHIAPKYEENVHFIFGWSDDVLRYINFVCNGLSGQTDHVAKMEI